jgi:hypothetical protein
VNIAIITCATPQHVSISASSPKTGEMMVLLLTITPGRQRAETVRALLAASRGGSRRVLHGSVLFGTSRVI